MGQIPPRSTPMPQDEQYDELHNIEYLAAWVNKGGHPILERNGRKGVMMQICLSSDDDCNIPMGFRVLNELELEYIKLDAEYPQTE